MTDQFKESGASLSGARSAQYTALPEAEARRIGLAKYLLTLAGQQARSPEPFCSIAVLTAHDAVELLLNVAGAHLGVEPPPTFLEYWSRLDTKLTPRVLPRRAAMARLNKARVFLKHHGTMASAIEVAGLVEGARGFFEESLALIFGIPLDALSLVEYVSVIPVREHLRNAEHHAQRGELEGGFAQAASAFDELLVHCSAQGKDALGRPLIFVGTHLGRSQPSGLGHLIGPGGAVVGKTLGEMAEAIDATSQAVMLMSLGIDLRKYAHFRRITPAVNRYASGRTEHYWGERRLSKKPDDLEFCISFVLESALKAQSFVAERLGNQVNF